MAQRTGARSVDPDKLFRGDISGPVYQAANPLARRLVLNFMTTIRELALSTGARDVHEIGCGEGQICGILANEGLTVRGCDVNADSVAVARRGAEMAAFDLPFEVADLFSLDPARDAADLVVCCEVLEHLADPAAALDKLASLARPWAIISVPNEPLWRVLNMARGKYWSGLGNTPGHIQHWTPREFARFVSRRFDVVAIRRPLPWTALLCRLPQ